ncbi:MAG TPA: non-heme iron oxygenase ferredoxin subunit, partial [Dehalococcoidia bacterium]|nr:non-heme iron oxygenase ferredoxin subunit [Dehalococcoidia bacterium]
DGTHSVIGFRAAEAAVAAADAAAAEGEAGYETVLSEDAVAEGEIVGVEVAGRPVVIGRVDGQVYAIGGICTHAYARLEEGELDGDIVMCPLHNSGFSIRDGSALRLPAQNPVPTYDVRVENGQIQVSRRPKTGNPQ